MQKKKEIIMCDSKVLHLKFIDMDSCDRLVYKEEADMAKKDR